MDRLQLDIEAGLGLLPATLRTVAAMVLLYTTSLQENPTRAPRQLIKKAGKLVPEGPAAGDYQFELGGGVTGVLHHKSSAALAASACRHQGVTPTTDAVFTAIQTDPVLAAALARLLYYTDPYRLPVLGDVAGSWALYLRTWRPGAHTNGSATEREALRVKWSANYAKALKAYGVPV